MSWKHVRNSTRNHALKSALMKVAAGRKLRRNREKRSRTNWLSRVALCETARNCATD
jgi:hypothetical protein